MNTNDNPSANRKRPNRLVSIFTVKTHLKFRFVLFCIALLTSAGIFSILATKMAIFYGIQEGLFTDEILVGKIEEMGQYLVLINAFFLFLAFGLFLLVAHVITGPVFGMEKVFERMRKRDISVGFRIRKGDELQITAEKLNKGLDSLRDAIKSERALSEKVSHAAENLVTQKKDLETIPQTQNLKTAIKKYKENPDKIVVG